jgi:hypothetical protein
MGAPLPFGCVTWVRVARSSKLIAISRPSRCSDIDPHAIRSSVRRAPHRDQNHVAKGRHAADCDESL